MSEKDKVLPHVGDEHWGKGGRYTVVNGKRVPVEESPGTGEQMTAVAGDTLTVEPAGATRSGKDKKGT